MHQHPNFLDTDTSFCFAFLSSACSAVPCSRCLLSPSPIWLPNITKFSPQSRENPTVRINDYRRKVFKILKTSLEACFFVNKITEHMLYKQ